MRMSGRFHSSDVIATGHARCGSGRVAGFTLLEMLVVLAIIGLATAMVAPSMIRSIDSWRRQSQVDALLDQVRGLPGQARARGLAIQISDAALQGEKPPLHVGEGWQLHAPEPWQVQANGVCEGGRLQLDVNGRERVLEVAAPFCEPHFEGES